MLRKTLLVTTALVLGASLAYAGQKGFMPKNSKAMAKAFRLVQVGHAVNGVPVIVTTSKRGTHPVHNIAPHLESVIFSNYDKDEPNAQFISWYGFTIANESSCYSYSSFHSCFNYSGNNALAFTPAATVTTRKVTVPVFSYYPSALYEVDIYSSVGGLPGNVIAHSKTFSASDTSLCCTASRTVPIKANLTGGTQYFLGVVGTQKHGNAYGGWDMESTDWSGTAVDYWHYVEVIKYSSGTGWHTYSYSSPWHASTYFPVTGAVILK
jgi:hypothetical protein